MAISYYNSKTKVYSDGTTSTIVFDTPIFRDRNMSYFDSIRNVVQSYNPISDFNNKPMCKLLKQARAFEKCYGKSSKFLTDIEIKVAKSLLFPTIRKQRSVIRSDSVKRAKDRIFDYVLSNDFNYFFTGTIDPKKMDSSDPKVLLRPVQDWLKNLVRRFKVEYIFVPEFHKDGKKIHFHGLIKFDESVLSDSKTKFLVDSKTKLYKGFKRPYKDFTAIRKGLRPENGRIVYNLPKWRFGHNTAIKLFGDIMHTAFYVTKYITKDASKIFGKFFWHSRGLKTPDIKLENIDYSSVKSKEYFNEHIGHFKYIFRRGEENRYIEEQKRIKEEEAKRIAERIENEDEIIFDGTICYSALTGEIYFECSSSPPDYYLSGYELIFGIDYY
ncbi:MAG: hypothetical protein K2K16_00455 [Ruminococcus sp.]|nr:hypothetical protein [Ruminococcus sp.]